MRTEDTSYGEDYFETLDGGDGYRDSTMWEDLAHIIKEVFAIDQDGDHAGQVHAIDVGCAKGFLVRHLRRRGFDAWGVDISQYAIDSAGEIANWLRLYDLTSDRPSFFGNDSFNFAVCFETMEHIPEPHVDRALTNILNLVKPGSQIVFTICTDKQPGWDSDPTHVTIRSREWWDARLDQNGYAHHSLDQIRENRLRDFWLFSRHDGVFVRHRPEKT